MKQRNMIRNTEASFLKLCRDIMKASGQKDFEVFNFDAHAVINSLPEDNLIGIAELELVNRESTFEGRVLFVVQTRADDTGIAICREMIDELFSQLYPGKAIEAVDAENGSYMGRFTIMDGVTLMPMGSTKGRPMQCIAVEFGSNLIVEP